MMLSFCFVKYKNIKLIFLYFKHNEWYNNYALKKNKQKIYSLKIVKSEKTFEVSFFITHIIHYSNETKLCTTCLTVIKQVSNKL